MRKIPSTRCAIASLLAWALSAWLRVKGQQPGDLVRACGRGSQRLCMFPSLDLLVVQFADTDGFEDASFVRRLLTRGK